MLHVRPLTPRRYVLVSTSSRIEVAAVPFEAILSMREEYRREMACQIVHDSWHARGFTTSYLLHLGGQIVGYGSVGGAPREPKETIKEFYLLPQFRGFALPLFHQLIATSGARTIEAQTNDPLLLLMLLDCAVKVSSPMILFADGLTTRHAPAGASFRRLKEAELAQVFPHTHEPTGEYGLEYDNVIVATGGLTFYYNPPYADLYMEVAAPYQRRGFGSYLVQELKRVCYDIGRIPAARCNEANVVSRLTLQRAGMFPCGRIVQGTIAA
jgi:GNAT superfamily N-acetyltransferase